MSNYDVIIVGAGPAGLGMGLVLKKLGLTSFAILERHEIGASFLHWPQEMRFITPSFSSNSFGLPDLNAIDPTTSPAFSLRTEHPSGKEYANYLQRVAEHYSLQVQEGVEVRDVQALREGGGFLLSTSAGEMLCSFLIWATGEFQYPYLDPFPGADLCVHSSRITSWERLEGNDFIVIGGYESGIDAAVNLAQCGKTVRVIDQANRWQMSHPDPSISLSPYTLRRLEAVYSEGYIELIEGQVTEVFANGKAFNVLGAGGENWNTEEKPILASGFLGGVRMVADLFEWHEHGFPLLREETDESAKTPGLFLVGPQVRHENVILCFIYKFRQRFAVVGKTIGERIGLDTGILEEYRAHQMYLDDLSCCTDNCAAC